MEEARIAQENIAAVMQNGMLLKFIPDEQKTPELCLAAVRRSPPALAYVPDGLKTEEMCAAAIRATQRDDGYWKCPSPLGDMPDHLKTPELCSLAVMYDGEALEYVPDGLKTPKLCMAAVHAAPPALAYVPDALKTEEMFRESIKAMDRWRCSSPLKDLPEHLKTPELCSLAVMYDGEALEYVPDGLKTPEMCMEAVQQDGFAIKYVPERFLTPELCLAAVRRSPPVLEYVPDGFKTEEMCAAAIKATKRDDGYWECPSPIKDMPDHLKTPELCSLAIRYDGNAIRYMPGHSKPAADPLEAACAAFTVFVTDGKFPSIPKGCSLAMEANRLDNGGISIRIQLSDPKEAFYAPGMEPFAKAVYKPVQRHGEADPAACLRAFASNLEGKSGKPVETMPARMKNLCASAVRSAAKAAEACAARQAQEECAGPRP